MKVEAEAPNVVLGRYGELWLKGKNRHQFERCLVRNARRALEPIARCVIERGHGQLVVTPEERTIDVARRLQDVFGLSSVSRARLVPASVDAIAAAAHEVLGEALESRPSDRRITFRVRTRRSDKSFPLISTELDRHVADHVFPTFGERLQVDLTRAELTLGIQVQPGRAFVFAERLPGGGGLPVGTMGRVTCLLSGGIDSPVAAWLAMKRGCDVSFVSFHSYPYIGASFLQKVVRLVDSLGRFQSRSVLYQVPFATIQTAIRDGCPEAYRTVLYRRMMQRIAARLARGERAGAVITGDSLGQVASQTLENLRCIDEASELPILRPLLTFDKIETIDLARKIGTYELSIEPEPDCCTVFQPKRPIIRGRPEACVEAEAGLDVETLVADALAGTDRVRV